VRLKGRPSFPYILVVGHFSLATGCGGKTQSNMHNESCPTKGEVVKLAPLTFDRCVGGSNPSVATHFRYWEGPGDGFGVVCHHSACTGASPACKLPLPRSRLAFSEMGPRQQAKRPLVRVKKEGAPFLSFPVPMHPNALQLRPRQVARYGVLCYLEIHKTRVQWLLICFAFSMKGKERMRVGTKKVWSVVR
jgi:hypothetical protein